MPIKQRHAHHLRKIAATTPFNIRTIEACYKVLGTAEGVKIACYAASIMNICPTEVIRRCKEIYDAN